MSYVDELFQGLSASASTKCWICGDVIKGEIRNIGGQAICHNHSQNEIGERQKADQVEILEFLAHHSAHSPPAA